MKTRIEADRKTLGEMLRFVIVGIVATAIHYGIYWWLMHYTATNVAYTTGFLLSFVCNYLLSSRFTFRSKTSLGNGAGFCVAHAVNYLVQMLLLNVYLRLGVPEALVPLPVYAVAVPVNFVLVRFVFRHCRSVSRRKKSTDFTV